MTGRRTPVGGGWSRRRIWTAMVPVTAVAAGLLFSTSASTAAGTDLRAGRRLQLTELIGQERAEVARQERAAASRRSGVSQAADAAATGDARVAAARAAARSYEAAAGLTAVPGPAVTVRLDDAPRQDGIADASDNPDDLVVHQQDVQSVVNALWSGGAEAMTLMGQRIIATTAVRCVGNTVIVHGRVYGPPFVVTAIGDQAGMRAALDRDPGVRLFRGYVDRFGLGYAVTAPAAITLPPYDGPLELSSVSRPPGPGR